MRQLAEAETFPEVPINDNFETLEHQAVYGQRQQAHSGLTWGYYGGRWGGFSISDGTHTLTNAADNYIVVNRSTGAASVSTSSTNWNDTTTYARVYKVTCAGGVVTAIEDHRAGPSGVHGQPAGAAGLNYVLFAVAASDETTALTTGTSKVKFHWPVSGTLNEVWAGLSTAQTGSGGGGIVTVDVNDAGSTMLSTKITIDNGEETSLTAATPPVLSDTTVVKGAAATIDIDQIGDGTAKGLKVYFKITP